MRTIDRLSSTAAISWLREGAGRLRRAMMARRPAVRLALVLAPVLVLTAVAYWIAGTLAPSGPRYLAQGRAFSSDDLIVIFKALDAKGISYRPDDRKVEVAADQYEQAAALIGKLDVGPHSISEIREAPDPIATVLETTEGRERRERLGREKVIEQIINKLEGVVWSVVSIQHPRPRYAKPSRIRPSAFVYLECESNRPLPDKTVEAIPAILTGMSNEPELSTDAITVMDRTGRLFLDPSNPTVGKLTRARAREHELRDQVADRLKWIKGVQIWVELADRGEATQARPAASVAGEEGRSGPDPAIAVNQPAALDGPARPPPPGPAAVEKPEHGRVLVYVPRSFYYSGIMQPRPDHREPTVQELHDAAAMTKDEIERLVKPLIPGSWRLEIGRIPDDVPTIRSAALPAVSDHRRIAADWGIIGAVAAAVALLMAMGSWIQAARRPSRMIESPASGRRYREDAADEPEPSERVRELVRRDPEVAASVLQRWATQGGRAS